MLSRRDFFRSVDEKKALSCLLAENTFALAFSRFFCFSSVKRELSRRIICQLPGGEMENWKCNISMKTHKLEHNKNEAANVIPWN